MLAWVMVHFGDVIYQTLIPRTVRLSEAPSYGQPIIKYAPISKGAAAYRSLVKEVLSRQNNTPASEPEPTDASSVSDPHPAARESAAENDLADEG